MKPNPCLDCNNPKPAVTNDEWGRDLMTPRAVECLKCSRVGQLAATEEQAITKWNEENPPVENTDEPPKPICKVCKKPFTPTPRHGTRVQETCTPKCSGKLGGLRRQEKAKAGRQ